MKQLLQWYDSGRMALLDAPAPRASGTQLVVATRASLISSGTERALVNFARGNLIEKARAQPDKVKQTLAKVRTDGVASTLEAVRAKLSEPIALGYCNAGVIADVGQNVRDFVIGDRVVTNGPHAELVRVPHTLAARIPGNVDFESAAFTPLAAIALQGIRLAAPTIGETVVVYGLGLVGLLAVQILRANGCRVIGLDPSASRRALAENFGAIAIDSSDGEAAARRVLSETRFGADAVLLTLASQSDEPVHFAAEMSRQRGRLVLVGVTGLNLRRDDFYRKELSFAVSCSYGPGRYDPAYEEQGNDYPAGFVRWTEQRNFEAVLDLMSRGSLDPASLVTHRYDLSAATEAYSTIQTDAALGVVLRYPQPQVPAPNPHVVTVNTSPVRQIRGVAGVIGAGGFAQRIMIPAMKDAGFRLHTIASANGTSAAVAAEKFQFERASTDVASIIADDAVDTVFVLTRHDSHARLAIQALQAGKHVFVEKPLALSIDELENVVDAANRSNGLLTVGFNRRFAPLTRRLQNLVAQRSTPLSLIVTVRAGMLPPEHWTRDPVQGGGRLLGEGCHFIDLARAIVGSAITSARSVYARDRAGVGIDDIAHVLLGFADGSTAAIHYIAPGAPAFRKERVEAFFDKETLVIDNWRKLTRFGHASPMRDIFGRQDKGHRTELKTWFAAVAAAHTPPIPLNEVVEVSRVAINLADEVRGPLANLE
jgi:predicted dehydrogenase/threonine dehydrogenase-like Zn-dependent dehydrogenase